MQHNMALRDTIRFRATRKIKSRFNRIARVRGKKPSDLGRQLIENFVKEHELAETKDLNKETQPA
jgi:hypothetical protein